DQTEEMVPVALYPHKYVTDLAGNLAINAIENELGISKDGIHGRPQFVTGVGEELRFMVARRLELLVELTQLLAGPIDVGGKRAKFVAICDTRALLEV